MHKVGHWHAWMSRRGLVAAAAIAGIAILFGGQDVRSDEPAPPGQPTEMELVTRGYSPWLSPNGRYVAFTRTGVDLETRDWRGQPTVHGILHIRDLEAGREWPANRNGSVTGWSGDELVILGDGSSLRVTGDGKEPRFPDSPEDLYTPSWTRSRDGRRVAFTARGFTMKDYDYDDPPKGREQTIHLVDGDSPPRPLDLGEYVNHEKAAGLLAFSPNGRHLAFRLGFMHYGQLPHPRIGVVDLESGTCTFVLDEAYGSRSQWSNSVPRGPTAWAAWDASGSRFVFVRAAGAGKRDIYTVTSDGKDLRRLTDDGEWKATPCLDPAGERCAYWTKDTRPSPSTNGDSESRGLFPGLGETGPHRLRVLMLKTGAVSDVATPTRGAGSALQWTGDGSQLVFGWDDADGRSVWRARAPAAPEVAADTPVVNRTVSEESVLLEALASEDPNEAEAALRRAWNNLDPRVTAALIDLLRRWVRGEKSGHVWTLLDALDRRDAVGAVPVLLDGLANEGWAGAITGLLLDWNVDAGIPHWRRLARSPKPYPSGWALVALARFGDDAAWVRVRERLRAEDADARDAIVRALAHVRDERSIEILIGLLADDGFLYTSDTRVVVGHHALESLKQLTGKDYGRDAAKWEAWWASAQAEWPPRRKEER